jgi:hypothetical protein
MIRNISFFVAMLALLCIGCGPKQPANTSTPKVKNIPKWYFAPKPLCAAGSAKFQGVLQGARDAANESARQELGRNLESKTQSLVKRYIEEGSAEGEGFSEELRTNVSQTVASTVLAGSRVVDGELDQGDAMYYGYVCLDTETFLNAFDSMKNLSSKAREALKGRADKEFENAQGEWDKVDAAKQ